MNLVALIGRLVKKPDLKYTSGTGMAIARFTLAVDKNLSKEKKQQFEVSGTPTADFIRIVVFGKQAENSTTYLDKGRKVAIDGSITTSSYKDKNGDTRYITDVIANSVEFLESASNTKDDALSSAFRELESDYDDIFTGDL